MYSANSPKPLGVDLSLLEYREHILLSHQYKFNNCCISNIVVFNNTPAIGWNGQAYVDQDIEIVVRSSKISLISAILFFFL